MGIQGGRYGNFAGRYGNFAGRYGNSGVHYGNFTPVFRIKLSTSYPQEKRDAQPSHKLGVGILQGAMGILLALFVSSYPLSIGA